MTETRAGDSPVRYPPAPWHMRGQLWGGFFAAASAPALPADLSHLAPRSLAVLLIRYREGTLSYDEFIIGSLVRRGVRAGLYVHRIWVDDERSLWGGRRIWGAPKRLAEFHWSDSQAHVTDREGLIATLAIRSRRTPRTPRLPLPLTGFGSLDGARTVFTAACTARLASATLHATQWPDRLPRLRKATSRFGFAGEHFHMTIPAPLVLAPVADAEADRPR
ncbi:acetoacetate decarboxylase family protein [Streptomyces sp. NPDC058257]|uniref:acetoacetate decarboxylase family protein n=1 Tax=Streptomyces sp. NPDC058257 TaxID=3346409 RepID=UPI0036E77D22